MCVDRVLTGTPKIRAARLAVEENPDNRAPVMGKRRFGMSSPAAPLKMAIMTGKKWKPGRVLGVCFLDGSATQRARVAQFATEWSKYCSITFDFNAAKADAQIRISFKADTGSWSYVGTDCLAIAKGAPTMNFGWLRDSTGDDEWRRVVLHEFGHALGAIHEHQNPDGNPIQWNLPAVYAYFGGEPNNWNKESIEVNVIGKYSVDQLNGTKFDPASIMLYQFDGALIKGGKPTAFNTRLSAGDKRLVRRQYP